MYETDNGAGPQQVPGYRQPKSSRRSATGIPRSTTDAGNSSPEQASTSPALRQRRRGGRKREMAAPEAAPVGRGTNASTRLPATDMREDLLAVIREISERNGSAERLAYSPDEAAELLGISRELVHDLLRTGQLGSVKAGRRRLIAKQHLETFLAGEP
jgi:excisionase family DNA binding protein